MNFGEALRALKAGKRVCRSGWNGKGMWLVLVHPVQEAEILDRSRPVPHIDPDGPLYSACVERAGEPSLGLLPWIGMKTADNNFVPWLASQTDILAEDWEVVP